MDHMMTEHWLVYLRSSPSISFLSSLVRYLSPNLPTLNHSVHGLDTPDVKLGLPYQKGAVSLLVRSIIANTDNSL